MIELTEQPGMSWWALSRGKLAACWWRLLAVQVLFGAVGLAPLVLWSVFSAVGLGAVGQIWMLAVGSLVIAWSWSAMLRILDGGHGISSALAPDVRRIGRLWGWLVVLNVHGLFGLLVFVNADVFTAVAFSPLMPVIQLLSLYLSFAAALLPMAILLEGRGIRRAWRLSHRSGWRTALRVLAVVLGGLLLTSAAEQLQALPVEPAVLLTNVLKSTLTPVLLYAAYRLVHPAHQQSTAAEAGAAETAPAEQL